eukprot:364337-Chlamydomonas_euryale.AAC.18
MESPPQCLHSRCNVLTVVYLTHQTHACMHAVYASGVTNVYPHVKPRWIGPCKKHSSRPPVLAYQACRGQGGPEAGGRGACTCMHVPDLGPALASAGLIGQDGRPKQACFVQE